MRLKRLNGVYRDNPTIYTASDVAHILGVDRKTPCVWIEKRWLKARRRKTETPENADRVWEIKRGDLRRFIILNLERIDFRKIDKFSIVDLLSNY